MISVAHRKRMSRAQRRRWARATHRQRKAHADKIRRAHLALPEDTKARISREASKRQKARGATISAYMRRHWAARTEAQRRAIGEKIRARWQERRTHVELQRRLVEDAALDPDLAMFVAKVALGVDPQ